MTEPSIDTLESALAKTAALIEAVGPADLATATPCPEFDVGALRDHLTGWARTFAAGADDKDPAPKSGPDYRSGQDPAGDYRAAAATLVKALRDKGLDRTVTAVSARIPATMLLGMVLGETVAHGWDLAVALDRPAPYSPAEARAAAAGLAGMLTDDYRGPDKSFGVAVRPPAHATDLERFIAFTGRRPRPTAGRPGETP